MEYRTLGRTGISVSQLCYGTMSFGGDADEQMSEAMFHRCREKGINFFDCANVYQAGSAEKLLGRFMAGCRDELVITTKGCMPIGDDVNSRGLSRRHIFMAVEASLERLGTDRVELYFVHHLDPKTQWEVTLRALDDLVQQGKILHAGVSNWSAWQIARTLGHCERLNLSGFECIQPMYNLVKRQAEVEILPMAEAESLAVINYSPLAGGLLAGKYAGPASKGEGRLATNRMYSNRYHERIYYEVADRFCAHAKEHGDHPVSLAVAWTMAHPAITCPIIGARNLEQLEASLNAVDVKMTPQRRAEISALSPAPALATDRAEEQD